MFNSSALVYAVANALEHLALKDDDNAALGNYARALKAALIATVDSGTITGDLAGKTHTPDTETIVDLYGFLDAVEAKLDAMLT